MSKDETLLPVTPEEYLIRKNGYYYRPFAAGYTINEAEAGRFTLDEAIRHSHPNGPDGPRDGIDYMPAPARQSHSLPGDVGMRAIVEGEKAHWLKEALKHKRPSGRHSDCAARDLDRAKVAQRILDKIDAALTPSPCPGDVGTVSANDAFEMGYVFGMALRGQNLEDSRAVGRLLMADSFKPIHDRIDAAIKELGFDSFQNADSGICQAKRIIRAALTPSALSGDAGEGRAWPTALTQGLREILGIPNFQCGPMAHAYQKIGEFSGVDGLALEKRAEDEQAFMLHKLLCFWFEHGDDWREPAIDEIDRAAKAARAALPSHQGAE